MDVRSFHTSCDPLECGALVLMGPTWEAVYNRAAASMFSSVLVGLREDGTHEVHSVLVETRAFQSARIV